MRWIVLGASGFIGRNLLEQIRAIGDDAIGTGNRRLSPGLIHFDVEKDSIQQLIERSWFRDPLVVVHCMGHGSIDDCLRDEQRSRRVAVQATSRLIVELAQFPALQVFLSTNHVFDGVRGYYREEDDCHPVNEYGRQKLAVEQFIQQQIPSAMILRLDKVLGTGLSDDTVLAPWWRAIQAGEPLKCLAGQRFTPVLIHDVVRSIMELVETYNSGVYHIAGPEPITRVELANELCRVANSKATIIEQSAAEMKLLDARPPDVSLDITKLRTALEFVPQSPREIVERFVSNASR